MKKTLIALAVLGSVAGVAQAQSAVTVYGKVDLGITKLSGDTTDKATTMQQNHGSRVGFKGTEDLGGGLSALFQIENRFFADDGKVNDGGVSGRLFHGPVFVGLAGGFGTVKLGRNWSTADSASSAAIDPFEGDGIGGLNALTRARINNSITYYAPAMSGVEVQAQYILGEKPASVATADQNNGYAVAATYNNGPIYVGASYGREENTNDSDVWGVSGSYAFGPAKIALGYDTRKNKEVAGTANTKNLVAAATYEIGAGLIKAAYNQTKQSDDKFRKFAVGYQHNLSKRTSLYADIARSKTTISGVDATVNGAGVGITHNF